MKEDKYKTTLFLQQWHQGDQKALESLLKRHLPWIQKEVNRRLCSLLRQRGEAEDFVQGAIVQLLRFAPRFIVRDGKHFRSLLLKIVENWLNDEYDWFTRRRRDIAREYPLPSDTVLHLFASIDAQETPSKSAQRHEAEAWVRLALDMLEPDNRELIVLRRWDGLSYNELGKRFAVTPDTARMRFNRSIEKLERAIWDLRWSHD